MEKPKVLGQGLVGSTSGTAFILQPETGKAFVTSSVLLCSLQEPDTDPDTVDEITYSAHIVPVGKTLDLAGKTTMVLNAFYLDATDSQELDIGSITLGDGDKFVIIADSDDGAGLAVATVMGTEVG